MSTPTTVSHTSERAPVRTSTHELLPLHCEDLSAFAKSLRAQLSTHLADAATVPGHVQLLNMLARAAGHRNVQALKAQAAAARTEARRQALAPEAVPPALPLAAEAPTSLPLSPTATKALTQFDDWGRLTRWPHKFSVQRLAMWALWTRFDSGRQYTEREVNEILKAWTSYGDHVTPRRELVEMGLLARKDDCSAYWKQPQRASDEVRAMLQALRSRRN
ncbi:MAG: DUF2087 domain-containing protein [Vitreoscilla sp.]|nr:DUF2087 domain-containing protein [Burkholderiales bacterium]MBP6339205.1 DUF2087 domain-containing protein [Vitreoscilla sp.]MBP6676092.1 DUF2087 domain-containing protein [Vitreoscilla sp.]